jgi:peptide/nickel transport system permease protein
MIPIITSVVLAMPSLILGAFLLERFFGVPGLGYLMIEAIAARDFFIINAMTFIFSLLIVIFTLLTDICYALVDPRISFK